MDKDLKVKTCHPCTVTMGLNLLLPMLLQMGSNLSPPRYYNGVTLKFQNTKINKNTYNMLRNNILGCSTNFWKISSKTDKNSFDFLPGNHGNISLTMETNPVMYILFHFKTICVINNVFNC